MKQTLLRTLLSICLCAALSSCRTEFEHLSSRRKAPERALVSMAKTWHKQKSVHIEGRKPLIPKWEEAWEVMSSSGKKLLVTPAPEHYVYNPAFSIRRFVVFELDRATIIGGRIVEFVGEKYDVSDNADHLIENYNVSHIPGYNGGILTYDINYHWISSKFFINGDITDTKSFSFYESTRSVLETGIGILDLPEDLADDDIVTYLIVNNVEKGNIRPYAIYVTHRRPDS